MKFDSTLQKELFRFGLAGIAGLVVDITVLYLVLALGAGPYIGRALSFLCAVWTTWQINRRFTFSPTGSASAWQEWWKYLTAMIGGGLCNYLVYSIFIKYVHPQNFGPAIGVALGSVAGMSLNFVSSKMLIFKSR